MSRSPDRHTAVDYAHVLKELSDIHFADAKAIVLVQDNLSTHTKASLYEAFPAAEARRLVECFEWRYTPKHGSWLNLAESCVGACRHRGWGPPRSWCCLIQDRLRYAAEECEGPNVAVAEGFRRLCRIADHEAGVRVRQVKSEEVDVALYATDDVDGFTKVCLSMPRPIAETAPWASFGRPPRARMAGRGIIRSRSRSQPRIVTRCSSYHHQPGRRYGRRWIP